MFADHSEMEKCPFCGSSLLTVELTVPAWGSSNKERTIVCNDCAASAPYYIWNDRSKRQETSLSTRAIKSGYFIK